MNHIENTHVLQVYENIAEHFDDTRFSIWDMVKTFLVNKNSKQKGVEIGCGNGKNILYNQNLDIIGTDNCDKFIEICEHKNIKVYKADCRTLPFYDNCFDYAMSIAVYHHLENENGFIEAIEEMIRVLKIGGHGLVSVWSQENQIKKWKHLKSGINYIKWQRRSDKKIFLRFYYIYNYEMIQNALLNLKKKIEIIRIYNEYGNWVIEFKKTS